MKLTTLILFAVLKFCCIICEDAYPEIEDLFQIASKTELEPMNVDIDIERIDLNKFNQKLDVLQSQLIGNETRRQSFPYHSGSQYKRASKYILKVKALDLSLQTIYMARHKVRQLEQEKYYDKHHIGYRMAFLYRKLRWLYRKLWDLFTMIYKRVNKPLNDRYIEATPVMMMHTRMIKLYEEFQYLYWVFIKIDGKYLSRLRTTTLQSFTEATRPSRAPRTKTTTIRTTLGFGNQV